jgi:hypothetical protein
MKPKLLLCLALVLSGGWLPLAYANLGETFSQINARYGQPVKLIDDPKMDKAKATYAYQFNNRRIYVTFMDGKSFGEIVRAPANEPISDKMALAIATTISGATNWTETQRSPEEVDWAGSWTSAGLQHHPDAEVVVVMSMSLVGHEMEIRHYGFDPLLNSMPPPNQSTIPNTNTVSDTKAAVDARVLKSQQELAEQGDRYGEYRMGLRYRDGDGVPKDLDKAREWLQKAADQGDTDAATELAKLSPKPELKPSPSETPDAKALDLTNLTILSAEFGMGKQVTNVTARVIELLQTQPGGFTADAKSLGADPLPGKKKHLVVNYDYKGESHTLTIPAAKEMSYQSLVKNASK